MEKIEESKTAVENIFARYADNNYMLTKTYNYICNQLPNILENMRLDHDQRVIRMEEMTTEQESFIQSFLNNNQYFYISTTEKFFYYDGEHYQLYNEDDILYHVLRCISKDGNLMSWKQRTKVYIMKRIKDNYLLKSIPESNTIQNVLDLLCPTIFQSRYEAKYFLTILGDNIRKINTNYIFFINPKAKSFIKELNNICQILIGTNCSQTIKYKYHEHNYMLCRLLKINEIVKNENVWIPMIMRSALDILCVASHYSIRYNNSDEFILKQNNDYELRANAFYLKDTTPNVMVLKFIDEYLQISNKNSATNSQISIEGHIRATQITWKNMQFLWKKFLDSINLPPIMFQQTLKNILVDNLKEYYKESFDSFVGISSKYLPDIQMFLQFWHENVVYDDTECDFEIDELMLLFNKWCETTHNNIVNLNDKQIIDIISYFFDDVEIERDKYINKMRCILWDKQLDIQVALDNMKIHLVGKYYTEYNNEQCYERVSSPINGRNISIYDAYNFYFKYFSAVPNKQIVSKNYFEKYVIDNLYDYIIDSKFISVDWLINH